MKPALCFKMHLYQNGYKMDIVINLIRPLERALEVEFLVRVSQKTKFGAGFSSTFVFRHLFLR